MEVHAGLFSDCFIPVRVPMTSLVVAANTVSCSSCYHGAKWYINSGLEMQFLYGSTLGNPESQFPSEFLLSAICLGGGGVVYSHRSDGDFTWRSLEQVWVCIGLSVHLFLVTPSLC